LQLKSCGDAGVSQTVLKAAVGPKGIKRYRDYLMTDISQDVLPTARSEFHDVTNYILDIEKTPLEQGLHPVYDVILSVNAIDASSSIQQTLENCGKLLKPGAKHILLEPSGKDWIEALIKAGFESGADLMVNEQDSTLATSTRRIITEDQPGGGNPVVHLLHGSKGEPALLNHLAQELERRGLSTKTIPFDNAQDITDPDSRVVAFLDGENLLLGARTDQHRLGIFQHLTATTASMIWITSCGISKGRNSSCPRAHAVGGSALYRRQHRTHSASYSVGYLATWPDTAALLQGDA
jgi:SAM-dependent methyltransferase